MPRDRREEPTPGVDNGIGLDPVAALAVACGIAGIFLLQYLFVPVTMVLAAIAGRRARDGRGDMGWAYLAFAVGGVDGILFLISLIAHGQAPPKIPS